MKNIKEHFKVNKNFASNFSFVLENLFVDPSFLFCCLNFISIQCNVTKILDKVNRYNDLIKSGLMAFNHFAVLGQMSVV